MGNRSSGLVFKYCCVGPLDISMSHSKCKQPLSLLIFFFSWTILQLISIKFLSSYKKNAKDELKYFKVPIVPLYKTTSFCFFSPLFSPVLCFSPLFSPVLCFSPLFSPVLCFSPLFSPVLCFSPLFSPVLCFSPLFSPVLCFSPLFSPVLCFSPLFSPVLCFSPLFSPVLCLCYHFPSLLG